MIANSRKIHRGLCCLGSHAVREAGSVGYTRGRRSGLRNLPAMTVSLTVRQAALFVACITCVAFLNSFAGTFVFDDIHEIQKNPALERLMPPWEAMFTGNKVPARPLPYLTFAIDHAIWGTNPFGYHGANLLIHVVAALSLFELTRCTLCSPRLRSRWGEFAVPLSLVIATIWAVHPLQTQSVTYIYQRIESLAGMCCLIALAKYARAAASGWPTGPLVGSVVAAAAAMASKESAVVLPFLVLAYDWFFVGDERNNEGISDWFSAMWPRAWFFAALAACWILIGLQMAIQGTKYQEFKEASFTPFAYALTQPGVILHYLRLAYWPVGQQIDYSSWPPASLEQAVPALLVVLAALAATVAGTVKRKPWGFLGAWFFLTLAPTSSLMPIEALANEHRMYLPLAGVAAGSVLVATEIGRRYALRNPSRLPGQGKVALAMAAGVILVLLLLTQFRNQLYSKKVALWLDVLASHPDNHRANWMLASYCDTLGDTEAAIGFAEASIRSKPTTQVFADLAAFHSLQGDHATAERLLRRGLELQRERLRPDDKAVLATIGDLAVALRQEGKLDEAASLGRESLAAMRRELGDADPTTLSVRLIIAAAASARGSLEEAESEARAALVAASGGPGSAAVRANAAVILSEILRKSGRTAEVEDLIRRTMADLDRPGVRAGVDLTPLQEAFAGALEATGRIDELVALRRRLADTCRERLGERDPRTGAANAKLAQALAAQRTAVGDHAAAAALYRQLVPAFAVAWGENHPETLAMKQRLATAEAAAQRAESPQTGSPGSGGTRTLER